MKTTVLLLIAAFCTQSNFAQDGLPDNSFGSNGKVSVSIGTVNQKGNAVALQADGKILVAGSTGNGVNSDFALIRLNPNGTLDNTFDTDGKVTTDFGGWDANNSNDYATAVAIQPDGKILVAGYGMFLGSNGFSTVEEFALARYNQDGSLDTTFDTDGKVHTRFSNTTSGNAYAMTLQPDGKILLAGFSQQSNTKNFALVRYNADGSLDTTLDADGIVLTQIGTPTTGLSVVDEAHAIALQADGKILLAGFATNANKTDFALARYDADGSLDTTFDADGKQTTAIGTEGDIINALAVQADGKLVVVGSTNISSWKNFAMARYNPDGSLDTSFDLDGKQTLYFNLLPENTCYAQGVMIQNDGKILIAGSDFYWGGYDFAIARLNPDGSKDTTFNFSGLNSTSLGTFDYARAMALQSDGKIVLAGSKSFDSEFAVVRYNNTNPLANPLFDIPTAEVVIYPNPSAEFFSIHSNQHLELALYTLDGKQVKQFSVQSSEVQTIQGLQAGVYLLKSTNENQKIKPLKIMVQ